MQKFALLMLLFTFFAVNAQAQIVPTPGMKITASAAFKAGEYRAESDFLQVTGADYTLDLKGVRLVGAGKRTGIGLHITDAKNITIKNADVSGFLWGIVIEKSVNVRLEGCTTNFNSDLKPGTVIDESGNGPEDQWGGGILIRDSQKCRVMSCKSMYQWDGIDVVRSNENVIAHGDFSFNGNWGVHFWDSSKNVFQDNRAVWCTTGGGKLYQALTGWQTYDAQAVAIDHNSCENRIEKNDLRFGGDGIFIRANEGPITPGTVVPVKNGSHRNILRNNDCSFSPNNAIEVDLVDDTIIEGNNCSNSHYGMWLGYSKRCIVRGNTYINDTAHAVEIENGNDDIFENNVFGYDTYRKNSQLIYLRQNGRDKTPSGGYIFTKNVFYGAPTGILLKDTTAKFLSNLTLNSEGQVALVKSDASSKYTEDGNAIRPIKVDDKRYATKPYSFILSPTGTKIRYSFVLSPAGTKIRLKVQERNAGFGPTVVYINGIPAWVTSANNHEVEICVPADNWDNPTYASWVECPTGMNDEDMANNGQQKVSMSLFDGETRFDFADHLFDWQKITPRINTIIARSSDSSTKRPVSSRTHSVRGIGLSEGRLLLNGKPVLLTSVSEHIWEFEMPEEFKPGTKLNVIWERGEGAKYLRTPPFTFKIFDPAEKNPNTGRVTP